jgi:hypothetical protein
MASMEGSTRSWKVGRVDQGRLPWTARTRGAVGMKGAAVAARYGMGHVRGSRLPCRASSKVEGEDRGRGLVVGWLRVGVGGGASADPATKGSTVEGKGEGWGRGLVAGGIPGGEIGGGRARKRGWWGRRRDTRGRLDCWRACGMWDAGRKTRAGRRGHGDVVDALAIPLRWSRDEIKRMSIQMYTITLWVESLGDEFVSAKC